MTTNDIDDLLVQDLARLPIVPPSPARNLRTVARCHAALLDHPVQKRTRPPGRVELLVSGAFGLAYLTTVLQTAIALYSAVN